MDVDRCANCGGTELMPLNDGRFRCSYCDAILRRPGVAVIVPKRRSLEIAPGAKLQIRKGAHVIVKGSIDEIKIGKDARVEVDGTLEIEEPGDPTKRGHHS
jgi:hypothetical protein